MASHPTDSTSFWSRRTLFIGAATVVIVTIVTFGSNYGTGTGQHSRACVQELRMERPPLRLPSEALLYPTMFDVPPAPVADRLPVDMTPEQAKARMAPTFRRAYTARGHRPLRSRPGALNRVEA